MLNVPENELFSAYLDGELTAQEQARVDDLLNTSPAARQLMDELRALSATLQALPVVELNEDLSGRVLRAAERQVLCEPLGTNRTNGPFGRDPASQPRMLRRILSGRALRWSGVAVAVAVLLALGDLRNRALRPGENDNDVAVVTISPADSGARVPEVSATEDPQPPAVAVADSPPKETVESRTVEEPSRDEQAGDLQTMIADVDSPADNTSAADQPVPEPVTTPVDSPEVPKPDDDVLIVKCDVSEKAVNGQVLSGILAKRKIARLNRTDTNTGRVLLEVDLTPTQLRALVADLESRREHFAAVSVPTIPGTSRPRIPSAAGGPSQKVTGTLRVGSVTSGSTGATGNNGGLTGSASATSGKSRRIEVKIDTPVTVSKSPPRTEKPVPKQGANRASRAERKFRVRFELTVVAPIASETGSAKSPAPSKPAEATPKTAK